jgi:hypothetical protein
VIDCAAPYVCIGRLDGVDEHFVMMGDADWHDLRDTTKTREIYVYDSKRLGIRRNRRRVLVRRDEIVALSRLADVADS